MKRFLVFGLLAMLYSCDNENISEEPLTLTACVTGVTSEIAVGVPYNFYSCSRNAVSYHWDFGNNIESTEEDPLITFPVPGSYSGTLETMDIDGKSAMTNFKVSVSGKVGTMVAVATCDEPYEFNGFTLTENGIFTALSYYKEGTSVRTTGVQKMSTDYEHLWTTDLLNPLGLDWGVRKILARSNGSIVMLTQAASPNGFYESELVNVQDDGAVTLTKRFYDDIGHKSQQLEDIIEDGNTLVAAGAFRSDSLWICRLDNSFQIIDEFKYGNPDFEFRATRVLKTNDGFIVAGQLVVSITQPYYRYFVMKVNDQLEEVWTSTFEALPSQHDLVDAAVDESGNTYVLLRYLTPANMGASKLVRLDSNGEENLSLVLDADISNDYSGHIYIVDNSILIASNGHITSLTTDADIEWERQFSAFYYRIHALSNSEILIGGLELDGTMCTGGRLLTQPMFLKMTTEGEVVED
jgi:PKD repeat protein